MVLTIKGWTEEDIKVVENATNLTEKQWHYLKVGVSEFEKLKPENFGELTNGLGMH